MKRLIVPLAIVALIAIALTRVDYGFYNPPRGVPAVGRDEVPLDPHARELLHVTATEAQPTLAALSHFYGTDDSLRCSVKHTFNSDDLAVANRPLTKGTDVTLCLN
jgi:hypothetical protein